MTGTRIDTIFLDMDGILTDFVKGACEAHGRICPFTKNPNQASPKEHYGKYDMGEIWGISPKEFWDPLKHSSFWFGLDKTEEADQIINTLKNVEEEVRGDEEKVGMREEREGLINLYILTAPTLSPNSYYGKALWIEILYPQFITRTIYTAHKHLLAKPETLLIDDSDKNVKSFREHGGNAILFPRLWNSLHMLAPNPMEHFMSGLKYNNLL